MGSPNQARDADGRWSGGSDAAAAGVHTRGIAAIKPVRLDNANSPGVKKQLGTAKQDRIIQMRATDARHFGMPGDQRKPGLMRPLASVTATPGLMGPGVKSMKFK